LGSKFAPTREVKNGPLSAQIENLALQRGTVAQECDLKKLERGQMGRQMFGLQQESIS
jgi:hypothetical protein